MAEHKVPQDVEADDKLLGPLSFRQFIYAMAALGGAALAYFIIASGIPVPLKVFAIVPILIFLCFGTLAIPRKGQPMEVYIGALIHFYFQPTKRIWDPDDQDSFVEITNPTIDPMLHKVKDISGAEASQRLSFLADIEDTQGWSTRGNVNLNDDYALAANMAADVFDDSSLNEQLSNKLAQSEQKVHDEAIARMNAPVPAPVEQAGFAPPTYATPAAPVIVTPPPTAVPAAPVTEYDEASLSAMLKQSAASSGMTSFQQTVIQPPGSSPVLDNPTLTTTATPVAVPVTSVSTPQTPELTPPTSGPVQTPTPPPAPIPEPAPAPPSLPMPEPEPIPTTTPAPEPLPESPKPDIMDQGNVNTTDPDAEEIVLHDTGTGDSNQSGEISLR